MVQQKDTVMELGIYCMEHNISLSDLKKFQKESAHYLSKQQAISEERIKRFRDNEDAVLVSGILEIDMPKQRLLRETHVRKIHDHEFLILRFLVANPRNVIPDQEILNLLESYGHNVSKESMMVYVSRLSKIVGKSPMNENYIKRKHGKGYFWNFQVYDKMTQRALD